MASDISFEDLKKENIDLVSIITTIANISQFVLLILQFVLIALSFPCHVVTL